MRQNNAVVTAIRLKNIHDKESYYIKIENGKDKPVIITSGESNIKRLEMMGLGNNVFGMIPSHPIVDEAIHGKAVVGTSEMEVKEPIKAKANEMAGKK